MLVEALADSQAFIDAAKAALSGGSAAPPPILTAPSYCL
jgi:hypothetical protein